MKTSAKGRSGGPASGRSSPTRRSATSRASSRRRGSTARARTGRTCSASSASGPRRAAPSRTGGPPRPRRDRTGGRTKRRRPGEVRRAPRPKRARILLEVREGALQGLSGEAQRRKLLRGLRQRSAGPHEPAEAAVPLVDDRAHRDGCGGGGLNPSIGHSLKPHLPRQRGENVLERPVGHGGELSEPAPHVPLIDRRILGKDSPCVFEVARPPRKDLVDDHILRRGEAHALPTNGDGARPPQRFLLIRREREDHIDPQPRGVVAIWNNKILARERLGSVDERCETDGFRDWEDVLKPSGRETDGHVDIPGDTRLSVDTHRPP